jgi:drug/metabolite transporter (DMT)-like permease
MWHFFVTAVVLYAASRPPFTLFKVKRVPWTQMIPTSAFFAGFLLLGNWSLALNSVGFYQLAKIMTTPSVVLLNFLIFRKTISSAMLLSIISVCVGVALTSSRAALSNPLGAIVAVVAFTVTALYQIWIGKKIVDLNVSAPQLLLNQAPVSVLLLACLVPFVDTMPDITQIEPHVLLTLLGSAVIASILNLSQFLIIGRTSALTFNIVSNLKNIIILAVSWYQENRIPCMQDAFGIGLAVGGAWAYAQLSARGR